MAYVSVDLGFDGNVVAVEISLQGYVVGAGLENVKGRIAYIVGDGRKSIVGVAKAAMLRWRSRGVAVGLAGDLHWSARKKSYGLAIVQDGYKTHP